VTAAIAPSLIGVMGAGLLVFVQRDLETIVEVNQGQKAFEVADAGVQAGRRQLLSDATADATTNIYDNNASNGDSPWSPVPRADAPNGGKNLTFDGKSANVRIQYLLPSNTEEEIGRPNHAPERVTVGDDYAEPRDFFKITSEGTAGEARRKIEAIYSTEDLDVPKGFYTSEEVAISGAACIRGVSVFSRGNATFDGSGGCDLPDGGKSHFSDDPDAAYGDWENPPFNATPRSSDLAGVGTPKRISGSTHLGTRDFDSATTPKKFVAEVPPDRRQRLNEMSFPFDYALPDVDFLRDKARTDGTYYEVSGGTVSVSSWPSDSDFSTVVFYRFTSSSSNTLKWGVSGTCTDDPPKQGTLVVENGNFTMQPSKALFRGAVVVRGGEGADGTVDDTEKTCLEGFINAQGSIEIAGNVSPMSSEEAGKRPGWYDARLWSWREVHE
jgi:hypothetical protein